MEGHIDVDVNHRLQVARHMTTGFIAFISILPSFLPTRCRFVTPCAIGLMNTCATWWTFVHRKNSGHRFAMTESTKLLSCCL